jgi:hypothetical protein
MYACTVTAVLPMVEHVPSLREADGRTARVADVGMRVPG